MNGQKYPLIGKIYILCFRNTHSYFLLLLFFIFSLLLFLLLLLSSSFWWWWCVCAQSYLTTTRLLCPWNFPWLAISSSGGSSWPRDRTHTLVSSALAGRFFTNWAIWDIPFFFKKKKSIFKSSWLTTWGLRDELCLW